MTRSDLAGAQLLKDERRQAKDAHGVGDSGAVLADPAGDLCLGEAELGDHPLVGGGGLDGIEVLTLDVLDEGQLKLCL